MMLIVQGPSIPYSAETQPETFFGSRIIKQ